MAFITRGQSVGNGVQTTFTLTSTSGVAIPYLAQADIVVTVNDVVKTLTTDYTFSVDGLSIIFNVAPANTLSVGWQRKTSAVPSVFGLLPSGSTPATGDLNRILRRVVYITQECYDGIVAGGTIALLGSGSWDGASRKLTNLANGTNPTDALTVGQLTGFAGTGTVTSVTGAGLASGTVTSTGPITVTAATQAQALLAASTSTALTPNSLVPLLMQGADIASQAALPVGIDGNSFNVTGTVAITSLNQATNLIAGRTILVTFKGVLTLTHNGTSLPLPGSTNITTANGDTAVFKYESGTSPQIWRCMNYQRASGLPIVNPTVTPGLFTVSYDSGNQTITAAGALTLAHSLGVKPKLLMAFLVNTVAELGYSVGDEVLVAFGEQNLSRGIAVVSDATNINVRFGSDANTFIVLNKSSGAGVNSTNTSWRLIIRAYA